MIELEEIPTEKYPGTRASLVKKLHKIVHIAKFAFEMGKVIVVNETEDEIVLRIPKVRIDLMMDGAYSIERGVNIGDT